MAALEEQKNIFASLGNRKTIPWLSSSGMASLFEGAFPNGL